MMRKRYLIFYTKPDGTAGCDFLMLNRKGKINQADILRANKAIRDREGGTVTNITELN